MHSAVLLGRRKVGLTGQCAVKVKHLTNLQHKTKRNCTKNKVNKVTNTITAFKLNS